VLAPFTTAAKEEMLSPFVPWSADECICAFESQDKKPHQGVAPQKTALHPRIAWSNSTTALGFQSLAVENRVRSRCTGKERDSESNLDYFGRRHYASSLGRGMTPDPLNLTRARLINPTNTLNKYVYGANNPLKYIDKDGEDITIFYRPPSGASGDYGHIMLGALNQASGKVGFLDYYPAGKVNGLGQGPGAFNQGNMSERAQQNADGKFAMLTIQTSPEQAQKVIDLIEALKNGSTPDYSALTNNCTTVCEDVLKDLGLDFGDVFPSSYWADVYNNFSADAQAHPIWTMMMGVHGTPGNEYGNPRNFPGVNNFSQWLFTLYMNQQQKPQPKACVEVDDGLGNHSKSCE
jgi:RHS repeat-associated protein